MTWNGVDTGQRLYVIAAKEEGPCKIGIAKDAEKRRTELQTGHPEKLQVWFTGCCPAAQSQEATIHTYLSHKRLAGEWFAIGVFEACRAVSDVHEWGDDVLAPDVLRKPATLQAFLEAVKKRCPDVSGEAVQRVVSVAMMFDVSREDYRSLWDEWEQRARAEREANE